MKNSILILSESRLQPLNFDDETICRAVMAWLAKELQK